MPVPSYEALRPGYARLWQTMQVSQVKEPVIVTTAKKILANKERYRKVAIQTGVPWAVIGLIDEMEAGGGCRRHLHNGDPLSGRTIHVPTGRPPLPAVPPFTWEQSALDALEVEGLTRITDWSIERACYALEKYNGFGYRIYHPEINSPYLWSYCQHYTCGKYVADGQFDSQAVSGQCGAMPLLRTLMQLDPTIVIGPTPRPPPPVPPPVPPPPPRPQPQPHGIVAILVGIGLMVSAIGAYFGASKELVVGIMAVLIATAVALLSIFWFRK